MIVVLFMFLSSMYITYSYQLENKYQKDNNLMTSMFYYLNLIYFWDSICLFIGKLVRILVRKVPENEALE